MQLEQIISDNKRFPDLLLLGDEMGRRSTIGGHGLSEENILVQNKVTI